MKNCLHPADAYAAVETLQHLLLRQPIAIYQVEAAERALDNVVARIDERASSPPTPAHDVVRKAICNAKKTVRARWRAARSEAVADASHEQTDDAPDQEGASPPYKYPQAWLVQERFVALDEVPDPKAQAEFYQVEARLDCETLLRRVKGDQHAVLKARLGGLEDNAIAEQIDCSVGHVACLASRAIANLRASLKQTG